MSQEYAQINANVAASDDGTLIDGVAETPVSVVYIPEEGFSHDDSTTLFDGDGDGVGSSNVHGINDGKRRASKSTLRSSIQQLQYNDNRVSLNRAINQTVQILNEFLAENQERPVFYPTKLDNDQNLLLNSKRAHLALVRKNNSISEKQLSKAKIDPEDIIDDLPEFKVMNLDLKMGYNDNNSLISNLDKAGVAKLLEEKINQQIKHLLSLRDRIDDTSSKVFVTGDLNAGKSTFCNALLRRKLLPEDQQPCTSVFCEVVDSKENSGIEEVHAIPIGSSYDIKNESTYSVHGLKELEDLVYECDKYSLLKVYVNDQRSAEQSLLKNGVIDIKLIDAPGLNMDSYQTTQVFSTQEEIDLVVFVVNAENHFTLSAKEFIAAAAHEKRFIFIVVNKFDHIKNKEKCVSRILDQVSSLSPDTHKDARDFVHFVSSSDVLDNLPGGGDDGDGDDGDDHPNMLSDPDFDHLEASLRKFVLEKRAISKLSPAKTYLLRLLNDLETLSNLNEKIYLQDKQERINELNEIQPKYDEILFKSVKVNDLISKLIDTATTDVYDFSKDNILLTINEIGDQPLVKYNGLQFLYEYAIETQKAMVDRILATVTVSENYAKKQTTETVEAIKVLGRDHLGDEFLSDKVFRDDLMFTRRRDTMKRQLSDTISFGDFFDPSVEAFAASIGLPAGVLRVPSLSLPEISLPSSGQELSHWSSALSVATLYNSTKIVTAGALIKQVFSASHYITPSMIRRLSGPVIVIGGTLAAIWLIMDIPNAFPRKTARKLRREIINLDYPHINSDRISKECRSVLNFPYRQVMNSFQTSIDKSSMKKEQIVKVIKDAETSYSYFHALVSQIKSQKTYVEEIDLESIYTVE